MRRIRVVGTAFAIGVALNIGYVVLEAPFGLTRGSLALVADAGHNLSDLFGLLLAWGAAYLVTRPRAQRRTYGYRRSSILAAMFNARFLLVAIGAIAWDLLRQSFDLALDALPDNINVREVRAYLECLDGVSEVHEPFGIEHPTIQVERGNGAHPCPQGLQSAV